MAGNSLVSIGLPVYNGARYLRAALESLLAQDYEPLELIISDNASTDDTSLICLEYAARDARIRYCRNETNVGAIRNFNLVFELATGKYFMWAAHDDWWHPTNISRCVEVLEKDPSVVLCATACGTLDSEGHEVGGDGSLIEARAADLVGRMKQLLSYSNPGLAVYGLVRADALRQVQPMQSVWGCDIVLLAELCLLGKIQAIPERLFSYRIYPQKSFRSIAVTLDPSSKDKSSLLLWKDLYFRVLQTIDATKLEETEKRRVKRAAALTLTRHWWSWINLSVADRARFKYLVLALEQRERGNEKRGALLALKYLLNSPLSLFDAGIWMVIAEGLIGRDRADSLRRLFRRYFPRKAAM